MPTITAKAGAEIFCNDRGCAPPVVFSRWLLLADDRHIPRLFSPRHGYRATAPDRHGDARSSQTAWGHDMVDDAGDPAAVATHLDVNNPMHAGHSTGGGEGCIV